MKTITIKKPISPQGVEIVNSLHNDEIPWVYNLDPSSGYVASMMVVPLDWLRGDSSRKAFQKWAETHKYLPIVERDFFAVWQAAWDACLDKVDAEMEGHEFSNAARDLIRDECK